MFCKHCGKSLADDAKFCDGCGNPVSEISTFRKPKAKKKKSKKGFLWVVIVFFLIGACGNMLGENDDEGINTEPTTSVEENQEETTAPVLSEKEQFVVDFCKESGFSDDCGEKLYDFLMENLLCSSVRFSGKNDVGNINWDITTGDYKLMVAADEDGIYNVVCGDYNMYDGESILYTCEDLALRDVSEYRSHYIVIAENIITNILKSPSTAQFQDSWDMAVARNGDLVVVQGYVDSQNSFSAIIRSDFIVEFRVLDIESFAYELVFLQIDGETVGEYIDLG